MKSKLIAVAALAALAAAAMPTKDEIAQANKEVQVSLKKQIAAWQSGDISDGDLAGSWLQCRQGADDDSVRTLIGEIAGGGDDHLERDLFLASRVD